MKMAKATASLYLLNYCDVISRASQHHPSPSIFNNSRNVLQSTGEYIGDFDILKLVAIVIDLKDTSSERDQVRAFRVGWVIVEF